MGPGGREAALPPGSAAETLCVELYAERVFAVQRYAGAGQRPTLAIHVRLRERRMAQKRAPRLHDYVHFRSPACATQRPRRPRELPLPFPSPPLPWALLVLAITRFLVAPVVYPARAVHWAPRAVPFPLRAVLFLPRAAPRRRAVGLRPEA